MTENEDKAIKYSLCNFHIIMKGGREYAGKINLLNQRFGKLLVIKETQERKNKSVVWECQCDCGSVVKLSTKELRSDGVIQCPNCGHNREPKAGLIESIIGKKFGKLKVISKTSKKTNSGGFIFQCQCDCGSTIEVPRQDLVSGRTTSCGCGRCKYRVGDIINNRLILDIQASKTDKDKRKHYYKCKCLLCGTEYEALAHTLDTTISCGCQRSKGEFNIVQILKNENISYIKEYQINGSNYRYDFAILNTNGDVVRLIEFDGEQHYKEGIKNTGWNTYQKYEYTYQNDIAKNILAKKNNLPLVRIPYWERDTITLDLIMGDKYLIQ